MGLAPFWLRRWGAEDYKAVITQLAKMRMNFLGIHCYPEGIPMQSRPSGSDLTGDFDASGRWQELSRALLQYALQPAGGDDARPRKTGDYSFGGHLLFEDDAWAPDVMRGHCPLPETPEACNDIFNRMACAVP